MNLRQTPAEARAAVQALAARGIKHTGEIGLTPEPAPPQAEIEVLKAIVDEAKKVGVQVNVHAVSSPAMVAAIDAGVTRLVHLPNKDFTTYEQAEKVAQTGSIVAGLIAFGAPNIDHLSPAPAPGAVAEGQHRRASATASRGPSRSPARTATRRAGRPAPKAATRSSMRGASGTPTRATDNLIFHRPERRRLVVLEHELKSFSIVFSMADIHRILTQNAARFVGLEKEIGTLETGKRADILLINGDVRDNIYQLIGTVKVVLKDGKIVVDKRPVPARAPIAVPRPGTR